MFSTLESSKSSTPVSYLILEQTQFKDTGQLNSMREKKNDQRSGKLDVYRMD